MGLSGLTWALLLRLDTPVSGSNGVPRRTGVRRVPRSLREVPACGAVQGCGGLELGGGLVGTRDGVLGLGGNLSHDLSKPRGVRGLGFETRIWRFRLCGVRVSEWDSGFRWEVPRWASLEAVRRWVARVPGVLTRSRSEEGR